MMIIPAIDIKDAKCVRLSQGRMDEETIYSIDPVGVAKKWEALGAKLIHVVDLDAAVKGKPVNYPAISAIAGAVNVPLQIGGGIRDEESANSYLSIKGVERIVIGTASLEDEGFLKSLMDRHKDRIAAGIDAKDGLVAIRGWLKVTGVHAVILAKKLASMGIRRIIYTDISRDGMLTGPNVDATKRLIEAVNIPVIASGGVSKLEDIAAIETIGAEGVIIGKALYSGSINLKHAIERFPQ